MSHQPRVPWRFPLRAVVTWAASTPDAQPYTIVARRYTEGTVGSFTEYLLVSLAHPERLGTWGYEADILEATP